MTGAATRSLKDGTYRVPRNASWPTTRRVTSAALRRRSRLDRRLPRHGDVDWTDRLHSATPTPPSPTTEAIVPAMAGSERDAVDAILDQWATERPDVDVSAIAVIGRISRLEKQLAAELARVFADGRARALGVRRPGERCVATGPPFELTVGEMLESMMLASGTITHRIDRLEGRGTRRTSTRPERRPSRACPTHRQPARRSSTRTIVDHAANEARLLSGLSPREQDQLAALLRRLHVTIDGLPTTE